MQTSFHLAMVRPSRFGVNPETMEDNAFLSTEKIAQSEAIARQARQEFDAMADTLRAKGILIDVFDEPPEGSSPDAVFPNNWLVFLQEGKLITFPMYAPSRRKERRADVIHHYLGQPQHKEWIDLSDYEDLDLFLEGTGSMVLDRVHKIAYACISHRTDPFLFSRFCDHLGWEGHLFEAVDATGLPVYHTNVMMNIGSFFAILCLASIRKEAHRQEVCQRLEATGHTVIDLSFEQMNHFAGNMLEVRNQAGEAFLVLSQTALEALTAAQVGLLEQQLTLLPVHIPTIEKYGGGSARCMIAEVFPPGAWSEG